MAQKLNENVKNVFGLLLLLLLLCFFLKTKDKNVGSNTTINHTGFGVWGQLNLFLSETRSKWFFFEKKKVKKIKISIVVQVKITLSSLAHIPQSFSISIRSAIMLIDANCTTISHVMCQKVFASRHSACWNTFSMRLDKTSVTLFTDKKRVI